MVRRIRGARGRRTPEWQATPQPHSAVFPQGILVPIAEDGVCAVVTGDTQPINIDFGLFREFPMMPHEASRAIGQAVAESLTAANVAIQVANGAMVARGLVQLAPETLQLLQSGANTVQQAGWNLGVLTGSGGQIVHSVRWLPASAATMTLSIAASAGTALALMAIQWQLSRIERIAEENLRVSSDILSEIQDAQRFEVAAKAKRVAEAIVEAKARGAVTASIWEGFGGPEMETSLESLAQIVQRRVESRTSEVSGMRRAKERLEWMNKHGLEFLKDLTTLIDAHNALFRYRALRVAYIVDTHPEDQIVAETVRQTALDEHRESTSELCPRLTDLWRYFSMTIDCPGSLGSTILARGRTSREVSKKASRIRDALGDLYEGLIGVRLIEVDAPPILQKNESLREVGRRIRWLLSSGETVRMFGPANVRLFKWRPRHVAVTNQRILSLDLAEFNSEGTIDEEIPVADVRFQLQDRGSVWRVSIYEREVRPRSTPKFDLDYPKSTIAREAFEVCLRDLAESCDKQNDR